MAAEQTVGEVRCPKTTGTYADILNAVGRATLIREIWPETKVAIGDEGDSYVVSLDPAAVRLPKGRKVSVGYSYLAYENAQAAPKNISPEPYPYVNEKKKEDLRRKYDQAQRRGGPGTRKTKKTTVDLVARPPPPERRFGLMKALNSLRSGSESWNNLARSIQSEIEHKPTEFFQLVVDRVCGEPNRPSALDEATFGVLQAFLPTAGKGTNRTKPDGAKLDGLKEPWKDWFSEWCKYRGVYYVLNAQFIKSDIKLQCLIPGTRADLGALRALADEFAEGGWLRQGRAFTNLKADVFALIGLARWLIKHSEFAPIPENRLYNFLKTAKPSAPRPRDFIAGISNAYFSDLGAGRALTNVNSLFLPDWFPVSVDTYNDWLAILDEHQAVLAGLDETKAEEAALLASYRNAISTNDLARHLDFFADFGANVLRRGARGRYPEQYTRSILEVLLMALGQDLNPNIPAFLGDSAFLSIADAVHEATVKAQYWKGQNQQEYEIHYGLAQQWKRAADRGDEFVQVLCDFVRSYNEENAKRREKDRDRPTREDVARADLDKVLSYLTSKKIDPRTVCLLILAYGYAMTDDEKQRQLAARAKAKAPQASATV